MSPCASPPLHVYSPECPDCCPSSLAPNLSSQPVPCFSRSILLLQRCSLHLPWCSCISSLWSFYTIDLLSELTHPSALQGLVLLSVYIRLLFSPSPLFLPAFGTQDGVLPALSSSAWCHSRLQHLGAAAGKKKSGLALSALDWALSIASSIFRGIFRHLDFQILGTLCWAYANEIFQRLVTRQKAGCFFFGIAEGQQGSYLPDFKLLLWRTGTGAAQQNSCKTFFSFLICFGFLFLPTGAKYVFPQSYFLKWLNPLTWNIKK